MLELFITSKTRRKIIVIYTKYPDFRMHVRGLAKMIKEDPGNVQRELKRLMLPTRVTLKCIRRTQNLPSIANFRDWCSKVRPGGGRRRYEALFRNDFGAAGPAFDIPAEGNVPGT